MYNSVIATSNTDIIVNSVVVLFVMEIDEYIFAGLEAWNENWTAHTAESVSSSGKEAEKGEEVAEMKDEISLQKAQIADQQGELKLQNDQLAKQNDEIARQNVEIAMLREAVQKMQESFEAASKSPESIPQCDAVEDLSSPSVESEDSACSDTGEGKTMDTVKDDFVSNEVDTEGGTEEQDGGTLQKGGRENIQS